MRADQDYRRIPGCRIAPQSGQSFEPIHMRHRHVQQHQVGFFLTGDIKCLRTVVRDFTLETEVLQDR